MEIPNTCCDRIMKNNLDEILGEYIGGRYPEYRKAWYNAGQDHTPAFPVHLDIELADACNQNCTFCPRNRKTHPRLPYKLNTKAILKEEWLAKMFREAEAKGLYSINIAFGEPLVYPKVFQVIRRFHKIGVVDSRIVTNGLWLDRFYDEIFDSGLVNLYVSIDAFSEETYRKQRGRGYDMVVNNVLCFLEERKRRNSLLPATRVSFVETKVNRHELQAFRNFWEDKVELMDIQFYQDFNNFQTRKGAKKWHCIDPFRRVAVTANGDILPCCTFYGKLLPIGNIERDTIEDAWNSERMAGIRKALVNGSSRVCLACQEC